MRNELMVALLMIGCATTPGATSGADSMRSRPTVVLARQGCCTGDFDGLLRQMLLELKNRAVVREVVGSPTKPVAGPTADAVAHLEEGKKRYLALSLEPARKALEQALLGIAQGHAVGRNKQLAEAHLFLAAVSYAEQDLKRMRRHCAAVMRYRSAIVVDRDLFSPPVHKCLQEAKKQRRRRVKIVSSPPGATVYWDGVSRGSTPLVLDDVLEGPHWAVLRHPLFKKWARQIHVAADVELPATLEALPAEPMVSALAGKPELVPIAARALGVDALVILRPGSGPQKLRYLASTRRKTFRGQLDRIMPSNQISFIAQKLFPPRKKAADSGGKWWLWALGAGSVAAVATTAAVLAVGSGQSDEGRPFRLPLPR